MNAAVFKKWGAAAVLCLIFWLGLNFLLPVFLPFLLALGLCLAAEPLIARLQRKMNRTAASGIGITLALILCIGLLAGLFAVAAKQLSALADVVPELEDAAMQGLSSLEDFCLDLAHRSPQSIRNLVTQEVEQVFSGGSEILDRVLSALLTLAARIVKALPDSALGIGTWVLASYMLSARLPRIRAWISQKPAAEKCLAAIRSLRHTIGGWLCAQCKLMGITFALLALGFLLLRIPHGILWAALIALADALPLLGTGTVLIPWALICLLQGAHVRAIGLLGIYAAAALTRSVLEPRFIGKELGLDPLITLGALYGGYRLWGFGGMLLAPLLTVAAVQLLRTTADG